MSTPAVVRPPLDIDIVTTLDVGPGGLDRYRELVGDRSGPLIKYRQGSLTLVSPSHLHECSAERLDGFIKAICSELDIDYHATATTLYRRPGLDSGIEADKTYYIGQEMSLRGVTRDLDLSVDPPPDLAAEIVVTHNPEKSLAICQELGIPEVWVYWVKRGLLEFLHLGPDGTYRSAMTSMVFPFLAPADVLPWLDPQTSEPDNRWERRLRAWVRAELAPRRAPS
jgi:Uma2 family endonuclease